MKCIYINLDGQIERQQSLEQNFRDTQIDGWTLHRFPAVDAQYVASKKISGSLREAEKACFVSHKSVIADHLDDRGPTMILEDDAVFGVNTCRIVDTFLPRLNSQFWDVLFTDVCVPQIPAMIDLIRVRDQIESADQVNLLNLHGFPFCGSVAYIVNPVSKDKVLRLLDNERPLNIPYDLVLRKLIYEKKLNGFVFFPFVITVSNLASKSMIQQNSATSADLVWNTFRQLTWMDRNLDGHADVLQHIDSCYCTDRSRMYGALFAAMLSEKFQSK